MSEPKRIRFAIFVAAAIFLVECTTGMLAHSVALVADSLHALTDSIGLGIALWAVLAAEKPPTPSESFGYVKAKSALAPFVNGVLLGTMGFMALLYIVEKQLLGESHALLLPMILAATFGLAGNIYVLSLIYKRGEMNANLRAAIAHVVSDTLTSGAVLVGGGLILAFHWYFMNAVTGLAIALWMLWNGWKIIRIAAPELLDIAPKDFPWETFQKAILAVPGVIKIEHRPHLTGNNERRILTLHLLIEEDADQATVHRHLKAIYRRSEFAITHPTVQLETQSCGEKCV